MARPLISRKRDIAYLVFFIIHLPVMFIVDLTPLYPSSVKPAFMLAIREFYITTYRDQFFVAPPTWFNVYMWMEALYHVPLSVWAIGALIRDDPKLPLHLLLFATQTGLTTLTCIADYLSWPSFSLDEKLKLGGLYVPYLFLAVFMGVDMYARLDKVVSRAAGVQAASGKKGL
ncbi:hypothetical protein K432DRAFT_383163 [Lepidopterella palustris CBS 459.81]|uniref:Efficient mitochondria targeting-associated protein 19 n=1 Tax=Lepidopterella palustris CBS 459.81 TaxID=1314670 RepID=A0A8E2E8S1_9PEZI|nr:hypothetical protein K432DRAFT_383163 [Lepidopterella palustris CBS 459.81]